MDRNYGAEIDVLRQAVEEMRKSFEMFQKISAKEPEYVGHVQKLYEMHPDEHIQALLNEAENLTGSEGTSGVLTYLGAFASGGRQSNWARKNVQTDELLALADAHDAERVLACIGSREKLNLIVALLRQPMTVAGLVEACSFGSTGQVYHHLKPLIAANLVQQDEHGDMKGRYHIVPHRVQGVLMLLAGVRDLLTAEITQGDWNTES